MPIHFPKSYGKALKPSDLPDGIARFFPAASSDATSGQSTTTAEPAEAKESGTGLPPDLLLPVLESVREDVAEVRLALSQVEIRMAGASLLIIYEADWERVREGLEQWFEKDGEKDDDEEKDDEDDDDEDSEDENEKRPGPPCAVKLIDFAHTRPVPGEGPDEGVLFGLDTVLRLLDGRIDRVKSLANASP